MAINVIQTKWLPPKNCSVFPWEAPSDASKYMAICWPPSLDALWAPKNQEDKWINSLSLKICSSFHHASSLLFHFFHWHIYEFPWGAKHYSRHLKYLNTQPGTLHPHSSQGEGPVWVPDDGLAHTELWRRCLTADSVSIIFFYTLYCI